MKVSLFHRCVPKSACELVGKSEMNFWVILGGHVQRIGADYVVFVFINHFNNLDLEKFIEPSAIFHVK